MTTFHDLVAHIRTLHPDDQPAAWARAECWSMAEQLAAENDSAYLYWCRLYVQINAATIAVYSFHLSALCEGRFWQHAESATPHPNPSNG